MDSVAKGSKSKFAFGRWKLKETVFSKKLEMMYGGNRLIWTGMLEWAFCSGWEIEKSVRNTSHLCIRVWSPGEAKKSWVLAGATTWFANERGTELKKGK